MVPPAGQVVKVGSYNTGTGSGALTSTTSTSWFTVAINGTNQKANNLSQSGSVITFNKIAGSDLYITMNFPTYNNTGGAAHGFRIKLKKSGGSYGFVDIVNDGPAHAWGFHGYGGSTSAMNNFTWCTADNNSALGDVNAFAGDVLFYFEARNWASGDTISYINHSGYSKFGTVQVVEVKT
tara:strand:- start:7 stop:546 length:540 start_codon:yes stop_codon:yes gene_type:complete